MLMLLLFVVAFVPVVYVWRYRKDPVVSRILDSIEQPETLCPPRASNSPPRAPRPIRGQDVTWNFRGTILDRLDEYFICIRRLRRHDRSAYDLYSRIGFTVSERWVNPHHPDNQIISCPRVAFGGVLGAHDGTYDKELIPTSFIYFSKIKRPAYVERCDGADVYQVRVLYDDRRGRESNWRTDLTALGGYHVALWPDGRLSLLKEARTLWANVEVRRGRRKERISLPHRQLAYPNWLFQGEDRSPNDFACGIFSLAMQTYVRATSRVVVRAQRQSCVAAFGIPLDRAKAFFRDRDATAIARDGRRKRIFHAVVAHDRVRSTNDVSHVRAHYRGIRSFDWNGYAIRIVLPELSSLLRYDGTGVEVASDKPIPKGLMSEGRAGEKIAAALVH